MMADHNIGNYASKGRTCHPGWFQYCKLLLEASFKSLLFFVVK